MIRIEGVPDYILYDIAFALGFEEGEDIEKYRQRIEQMDPVTAFRLWCTWNGLVGWTGEILGAIKALWGIRLIERAGTSQVEKL